MVWTFRIALPVAAAFAIRHTLKAKPPERLAEKLRGIAREPRLDVSALRHDADRRGAVVSLRQVRAGTAGPAADRRRARGLVLQMIT